MGTKPVVGVSRPPIAPSQRSRRPVPPPAPILTAFDAERQAAAVAAALHGRVEGGSVIQVGRVAPAALPVGVGNGRALPFAVRTGFEQAFAADLSRVRVHDDAAAAAIVDANQAQALAAGVHVLFGTGHGDLSTAAGRALWAHELVHVLQQTGRHDPATGRLHATPQVGASAPQASSVFDSFPSLFTPPTFAAIAQRHREANPGDLAVEAAIKAVASRWKSSLTGVPGDKIDEVVALAEAARSTKKLRAWYIDVLKGVGRHDKAVELAADNWRLDTAFLSRGFYDAIVARTNAAQESIGFDWLVERASKRPFTSWHYPKPFVDRFRAFLADPFAVMTKTSASLSDMVRDEIWKSTQSGTPTGLFDNETGVAAVLALRELENARLSFNDRRTLPSAIVDDAGAPVLDGTGLASGGMSRASFKQAIAKVLATGDVAAVFTGGTDEFKVLAGGVMPDLAKVGRSALAVYEQVDALWTNLGNGQPVGTLGEASAFLLAIGTDKRFAAVGTNLNSLLTTITAKPAATEFSITSYPQIVAQLQANLAVFAKPLAREALAMASADAVADPSYQVRVGVVLSVLSSLSHQLESYAPTTDAAYVKAYQRDDVRRTHRVAFIRRLANAASVLGFAAVAKRGFEFLNPGHTHLAMIGSFVEVPMTFADAWVEVRYDMSTSLVMRGLEPFTVSQLERFIYALYYARLTDELKKENDARRDELKAKDFIELIEKLQGALAKQAITVVATERAEQAMSALRPRKWVLRNPDGYWANDPDELVSQITGHPRYQELKATWKDPGQEVFPLDPGVHRRNGITVWRFPAVNTLIATMTNASAAGTAGVRAGKVRTAAVAAWGKYQAGLAAERAKAKPKTPTPTTDEAPSTEPGTWNDWWLAITLAYKGNPQYGITGDPTLATEIEAMVADQFAAAKTTLDHESRRANNHARALTRFRVQDLKKFDEGDLEQRLKNMDVPLQVMTTIQGLAGVVLPEGDRPYQVAALMLEEAPLFHAKLTGRYDIVAAYLPVLRGTLTIWNDPTHNATLKTLASWNGASWDHAQAAKHAALLTEIASNMETARKAFQTRFGLVGAKAGTLRAFEHGVTVGVDQLFQIEGIRYQVKSIACDFEYHGKFLRRPSPIAWPEAQTTPDSLLTIDGVDVPGDQRTGRTLLTIVRQGKERTITDKDDSLLEELSYATSIYAVTKQLEALGEALETFAEVGMTAVELLQPEIAAARIGAAVLQFLVSPEFEALKEMISTDGIGVLGKAFEKLAGMFSLEAMVRWVLFGPEISWASKVKPEAETPAQARVKEQEKSTTSKSSSGGVAAQLGRLIARVLHIGKKTALAIDNGRRLVQAPVRRAQDFIVSHPLLRVLFAAMVEVFEVLARLDWAKVMDDPAGALKSEAKKGVESVVERLREAFARLSELELPEELIPMEAVVEIAVDLGLRFAPKKYKAIGKGIIEVLRLFGWWDQITSAIATELKKVADPNEAYRKEVKSRLDEPFTKFRDDLTRELTAIFAEIGLGTLTASKGSPIALGFFGEEPSEEEPAAQPLLRGATPTGVQVPGLEGLTGGAPLPSLVRRASEARLGSDLGHVRVHQDARADAATAAVGAFALTTGSHVLLAGDVAPATAHGAAVLGHELGHVVQQTGSRPLGAADPTPTVGAPHRGLIVDPGAEARASSGAGRQDGVQPALRDLFGMFMANTVREDLIEARAHAIDAAARKGAPSLDTDSQALSKAILDSLPGKLDALDGDLTAFAAPFNDAAAAKAIIGYLRSSKKLTALRAAIPELVAQARRKVPAPKPEAGSAAAPPTYLITPHRLELELEEYLFGSAGTAFEIVFNTTTSTPPGAKRPREVVDTSNPLKSVKLRMLHLNFIGGNAALWDTVLNASFTGRVGFDATSLPKYRSEARVILRGADKASVWDSSAFKLSAKLITDIEASLTASDTLTATDLPPAKVYLTTNPDDSQVLAHKKASGHVGLRLGTYRQSSKGDKQWGVDRESHHLTQFLLLEYLHGDSTLQPFKLGAKAMTPFGVGVAGGNVDTISNGTATIKIGTNVGTASQRGPDMPTLLIARRTHQSAVHVPGEKSDELGGKVSQGGWADNRFQAALGDDATGKMIKSDAAKLAQVGTGTAVDGVDAAGVRTRVFTAACSVYRQMRDVMMPRLEAALANVEHTYYMATAQRAGRDGQAAYQMSPDQVTGLMKAIRTHNDTVMEGTSFGFK